MSLRPKERQNSPNNIAKRVGVNQQVAQAVRPQLPRDGYAGGTAYHASGQLNPGGYTPIWCFDGSRDTKRSPTSKPEKNKII